jgi:glucosamine--fructose-6-phosphate aminotransferase (isomerizing)
MIASIALRMQNKGAKMPATSIVTPGASIPRGTATDAEILSQPEIWRDALAIFQARADELGALWQGEGFEQVVLTGCGSTYYAGLIGATLIQEQTGIPAQALPASEFMLFPQTRYDTRRKTLLITVSRSGATHETTEAARLFRKHVQGTVMTVTCHSESTLAQEADVVLAVDSAREQSRAQTRSFSSMVLMLQALALTFAGRDAGALLSGLPDAVARLLAEYEPLAQRLGEDRSITRFMFLGMGVLYGLACEAMLKMLETTLVPSMVFHALEFLHGPRYIITPQTMTVALLSEAIQQEELKALEEARTRGSQLVLVSEKGSGLAADAHTHEVLLDSGLPIEARAILYLPVLQRYFYHQSMTRGRNPDQPGQ